MKPLKISSLLIILSFSSSLAYADFGAAPQSIPDNILDTTTCQQVKLYPIEEHAKTNAGELLYSYCRIYCYYDCANVGLTDKNCSNSYLKFNSILDATSEKEYFEIEDMNKLCQ